MQQISIIGNVGNDAEVKDLGNNQLINFSVAVTETYTDKENVKQTKTMWFDCTKWGNNTTVAKYIKKGDKIFVSGKPNNRAYAKDDGTVVSVNGINVFEIELLGSKPQEGQAQQSAPMPPAEAFAPATNFNEEEHDDLPF